MRVEMTGRAWRQRGLGAALACVLVAAGCTSSGPADGVASSAPSDSATPEQPSESDPSHAADSHPKPRPSAPTLPAAAEGDSVRAAEAFVRHYIELLNYAMTTGDTKAFRAASRDCEGCDRYAELFEEIAHAGGLAKTKGWSIDEIAVTMQTPAVFALFNVGSARVKSIPSKGSTPKIIPPDNYSLRLVLGNTHGEWFAREFTRS